MLIAACITYSPQMSKEITSLQNSSTVSFLSFSGSVWKAEAASTDSSSVPERFTSAMLRVCTVGSSNLRVRFGLGLFMPTLATQVCCSIYLFVSFFFFPLEKQEPQKLDPVIFLWLQRRRHRCTLRGSHSVRLSIRFLRIQVFWIVLARKPISLRNNECPSAYRSVCRDPFCTEHNGSVFLALVFWVLWKELWQNQRLLFPMNL